MRKVIVETWKNEQGGTTFSFRFFGKDTSDECALDAVEHDINELTDEIKGLSHTTSILTKERAKLKELRELIKRDIEKKKAEAVQNGSNN